MKQYALLVALTAAIAGCSHPIEIVGEGDVMSASGNRDCLLEDFQAGLDNCAKNMVSEAYSETYYAVPRNGWQFNGWGNSCRHDGLDVAECSFNVPAARVEAAAGQTAPPLIAYFRKTVTESHHALLMGHSFFDPYISGLNTFALGSGFDRHDSQRIFAGGGDGSAAKLWELDNEITAQARSILDEGGLSLVGMTLFGWGRDYELQGYRNWIEYTLTNNPEAAFFIAVPWGTEPGTDSVEVEQSWWDEFHTDNVHYAIDVLRDEFPGTSIYCIPYGAGAYELRKLLEADQLPGVQSLIRKPAREGVHYDTLGHPDSILIELGSLIWLGAVYGVDLTSFDYQELPAQNFSSQFPGVDLAAIAHKILSEHDHRYDSP